MSTRKKAKINTKIPSRLLSPELVTHLFFSFLARANRTNQLNQCCTQFKFPGVEILCVLFSH